MKYMGSKRAMLMNGLGQVIERELEGATRFVDLFAGSGAVAVHVARKYAVPVMAYDLQSYSAVLTRAVLLRERQVNWLASWRAWVSRARLLAELLQFPSHAQLTRAVVEDCRRWCAGTDLPITKVYGGYYFSPTQAVWIDALRQTLPQREPIASVALAALIQAASRCAASPGHTAQPFRPSRSAKPFLQEAWNRDVMKYVENGFAALAEQFARKRGQAAVGNANEAAKRTREGDLVFVDPPYSGVHYSRFYHVLETIALGECGDVSGAGRYPDPARRPRSLYSLKSESEAALDDLLTTLKDRGARAILTFPQHLCSNGLSGLQVRRIAECHFNVHRQIVAGRFSTLGGNNAHRDARHASKELILVLRP